MKRALIDKQKTFVTIHDTFANTLDIKQFGTWLKENANLRGGGSKSTLQGGGAKFDAKLKDMITAWIGEKG